MQPVAAPTLESLAFLADPNKTKTATLIRVHAFTACFERVGKEGQLAVTQPVEYISYQAEMSFHLAQRSLLTDYNTPLEPPFIFERKIVHRDVQIIVHAKDKEAKRIEELVLPKDFYRPPCECSKEAAHSTTCAFTRNFAKVDLSTAINTTTGKLHLLVLAPVNNATFTVTSYSEL